MKEKGEFEHAKVCPMTADITSIHPSNSFMSSEYSANKVLLFLPSLHCLISLHFYSCDIWSWWLYSWIIKVAVTFWVSQRSHTALLFPLSPLPLPRHWLREQMTLWNRRERTLGLQRPRAPVTANPWWCGSKATLCPGRMLQSLGKRENWKESQREVGAFIWVKGTQLSFLPRLTPGGMGWLNKKSHRLEGIQNRGSLCSSLLAPEFLVYWNGYVGEMAQRSPLGCRRGSHPPGNWCDISTTQGKGRLIMKTAPVS